MSKIEKYLPFLVFGAIAYLIQSFGVEDPQFYFLLGSIAGIVSVANRGKE